MVHRAMDHLWAVERFELGGVWRLAGFGVFLFDVCVLVWPVKLNLTELIEDHLCSAYSVVLCVQDRSLEKHIPPFSRNSAERMTFVEHCQAVNWRLKTWIWFVSASHAE